MAIGSTWWFTRNFYNNREATDKAFLRLDSSLNISSKFLMGACLEDSNYVNNKSRQPGFEKIRIFYKPKIDSVMLCARKIHDYIQLTKEDLNLKGKGSVNHPQKIKNNSWNNETVGSLYDSLSSYSTLLLNILPFKMQ